MLLLSRDDPGWVAYSDWMGFSWNRQGEQGLRTAAWSSTPQHCHLWGTELPNQAAVMIHPHWTLASFLEQFNFKLSFEIKGQHCYYRQFQPGVWCVPKFWPEKSGLERKSDNNLYWRLHWNIDPEISCFRNLSAYSEQGNTSLWCKTTPPLLKTDVWMNITGITNMLKKQVWLLLTLWKGRLKKQPHQYLFWFFNDQV